jgi:4-amino-4-deoxy-L-arabinose transferase-like glycosyltransferase
LIGRLAGSLATRLSDVRASNDLVAGMIVVHVVLWTLILMVVKWTQDIHFDIAEAYAWGREFHLGYGKHPPVSGWIAGLWFRIFPAADWAAYALAMTVIGAALWICWLIAIRVVDRKRAVLSVLMLAIYPIFNFKGYKYNADLAQLLTLPLVVLAYLHAFETRSVRSGVGLGLAAAVALLTKYWAVTVIGAVGIAALLHPQRLAFLRSPAPWVAIGVMLIAVIPHLLWLAGVDFMSITYARDIYEVHNRAEALSSALDYAGHTFALLLLPIVLGAITLFGRESRASAPARAAVGRERDVSPEVDHQQAIHIWIIQFVLIVGPPLGAVALAVKMKSDWGIPIFFLVPLALVAIPQLRVPRLAPVRLAAIWLGLTIVILAASPLILHHQTTRNLYANPAYLERSQLASELTAQWHRRFASRWPVVAGPVSVADLMTFYSPDHPTPFTPYESWSAEAVSVADAVRQGFIGICDPKEWDHQECSDWMHAHAAGAEHLVMTTRRVYRGEAGPAAAWEVYIVPPARASGGR